MKTFWEKNNTGIKIGTKNQNVKIKCLAFADDLALFADSEQETIEQINQLEKTAKKAGLQINFSKTEIMINNNKINKKLIKVENGKIKTTKQFKYLGEIISGNGSDQAAMEDRKRKLEQLDFCTRNIYNKKHLSVNAKLRHYNSVIRPVILYGSEEVNIMRMENILKIERRILRRIYGPKKTREGYRLRPNKETYDKLENMEMAIRKRRRNESLKIYGITRV